MPFGTVLAMTWTEIQVWMEEDRRFPLLPDQTVYAMLGGIQHAVYQSQAGRKRIDFKKFIPLLLRSSRYEGLDRDIVAFFE